jgi:exosortase A
MTGAGAHAAEAADNAAETRRALGPAAMLALAVLAVVAAFYPTLTEITRTWLSSSSFHHGLVVAPIAFWLCLRLGPPQEPARIWPPALLAILAVLVVWLVGRAANVAFVEETAFVAMVIALAALLFGPAYIRRWAFPLAFLFFMVPVGGGLLPLLQDFAAGGVIALLHLVGVEAARDGLVIATSAGRFAIAEACAGLNFLIAALMIAALFAHLSFRTARKALLFIGFSALFAIAANVLRAFVVILADTLTGGRFAIASNHFLFGWVFYGALIFVLIVIGRAFADAPADLGGRGAWTAPTGEKKAADRLPAALAAALTLILCGSIYDRLVIDKPPQAPAPSFLPLVNAPGWRALPPTGDWNAPLAHADRVVQARYQSGTVSVQMNAAFFTHDRPGAEIAGYNTRSYDGRGWRRISARTAPFLAFGALRRLKVETLENPAGDRLEAVTLYWFGGELFADPVSLKISEARARLFGAQKAGGAIILAAPAAQADDGVRAIDAFFKDAEPFEEWLARIDARLPK